MTLINPFLKLCCGGKLHPSLFGKKRCCGTTVYDSDPNIICCGGKLQSTLAGRNSCCGTTSYDPNRRLCCQGYVRINFAMKFQCCGINSYYPGRQDCCYGDLVKFKSPRGCNGTELFSSCC